MAGHMQQRGDSTWRLHVFIGQDSNGKRRYASKTFHGSKKQASTALAAFVTETAKDRNATEAAEPMMVSVVVEKWLAAKKGPPRSLHDGQVPRGYKAHRRGHRVVEGRPAAAPPR